MSSLEIRHTTRALLEALSREFDETVHLTVLEGNGVRFVDGIEGGKPLRVSARTGMLLPAHVTAGGKALLARLPEDELRALYPRGMATTTAQSITDIETLFEELRTIADRGYSVNHGESDDDIVAVAVCVRRAWPVGAIAVAAPRTRMPAERVALIADRLDQLVNDGDRHRP